MAHIFLTFIGTGLYKPVNYTLEGDAEENRFVSKAMLKMLTRQEVHFDHLYFFLTKEARALNWKHYIRKNRRTGEIIDKDKGLEAFLQANFPGKFTPIPIPDGNTEEEIAELFTKIKKIAGKHPAAVMCMGEMGLCWHVVSKLKAQDIRVVHTCTQRQAVEYVTADSTQKTSVFRFTQFREY